jgi:protocatechuate 3,4-dioxygenase beta subunit
MLRAFFCLLVSLSVSFAAVAAPGPLPLHVTGRILPPVPADVRIEMVPVVSGYAEAVRLLAGEPVPPLATAQPHPDGSFEIQAPESGLYRVRVRAAGRLLVEVLLIPLAEDVELPPVALQPAPPLQITVLGPDGQPVPHLRLRALSVQAFRLGPQIAWRPAQCDGVTDAAGQVTLPQGGVRDLSFVALAPGVPDRFVETVDGPRHTLHLTRQVPRSVEVRGRDGKPLAGVLVRWNLMPFGLTGSDGRLALPASKSGATLRLEDEGGFLAESPVSPEGAEEKGLIAVRLPAGRTVTGRVLDAESRKPLAGALVWGGDHRHVRTAADGRFSLRVFGAGAVSVDAAAAGHLPASAEARPEEPAVTLNLPPAASLTGIVVTDGAGQPVSGAEIQARRADGRFQSEDSPLQVPVLSGADGRFRLAGLAAGQMYEVAAKREGFAPATVPVAAPMPAAAQPAAARAPLRIVLHRGAAMAGRVVTAAGEPVAGADLILRPVGWRARSAGLQAQSDATGHFRFADLGPGFFDLRAKRHGFAAKVVPGVEIPQAPRTVDLGDVALGPGAAIEGRVTDRRGAPVAEAEVQIECPDFFPWAILRAARMEPFATGTDGRFRIEDLTPGATCRLSIQHAGHTSAQLPGVKAPTREPLRIELAAARALSGRITGPLDEPVPEASVQIEPREMRFGRGGREDGGRTDAEGRFRIEDLPAGPLDLTVSAPGYRQKTVHAVEVPEAGGPPLEISLAKGETLTGTVTDGRGDPMARVTIRAILMEAGAGNVQPFEGITDGEGRYRMDGLEAAHYMANLAGPEGGFLSTPVTVRPGVNRLDFTFPGGEVEGRVLDRGGAPIPGAVVGLQAVVPTGMPNTATAAADGTFHLRSVADGDYLLTAQAEGFASPAEPDEIHVSGQAVQGLELRLDRGAVLTGKLIGVSPGELGWGAIRAFPQPRAALSPFSLPAGVVVGDGYRIAGLHPGTWEVTASTSDGRSAHGSVVIEPGMDQATLDLEWPAGYTLSGRILVDRAPLADAFISLQLIPATPFMGGGSPQTAWDGSFRITGLAPGRYRLWISSRSGLSRSEELEISGDREINLEISTGSLAGEVLSAAGQPVAGALVSLEGDVPGGAGSMLRSDEQGRFEAGRLATGSYRVTVQKAGFAAAESRVVVTPGGTVQVQVVLKEGR